MEIKVKLSKPVSHNNHHRDTHDDHMLRYLVKKEDTLDSIIKQIAIDVEGLSKNYRILIKGKVYNN